MVCKTTYDSLFVIYATFRRPAQKQGWKELDSVCADEEEFRSDDDDRDDESL